MSERHAFRVLVALVLTGFLAVYAIVSLRDNRPPLTAPPQKAVFRLLWHDEPKPIPDVPLVGADGAPLSLSAFQGRAVLLNLWASWCAPCVAEMPALSRLQAKRGGETFTVVAVNLDRTEEDARTWLTTNGITNLPLYSDPKWKLYEALNAPGLPLSVLIDAEGREVARIAGAVPWDHKTYQDAITRLGAGLPPAQP